MDALVLALIGLLAWSGARRGAAIAGVQLVGLPLAYAGAVGGAFAFGPALARELGWAEAAGTLTAGTAGLVLVQLFVSALVRTLRDRAEPDGPSQAVGAVFGALRGALFALPLLWLASLAEGARSAGVRPELPDLSGAQLPALGTDVLGAGADALLDARAPGGRVAAHFVRRPAETLEAFQQVVSDPRVISFSATATSGRTSSAARCARRSRGPRRASWCRTAPSAGGSASSASSRPRPSRARAASSPSSRSPSAELGPRLESIRSDPALAELLADPEVRASLQSGNTSRCCATRASARSSRRASTAR